MARTGFQVEAVTPPIEYGMLADRAQTVLWKLEKRKPVTDLDRKALDNAKDFIERALGGGSVLSDRNMRNYSFEAMSAYEAALNAAPSDKDVGPEEVKKITDYLGQVKAALEAVEGGHPLPSGWSLEELRKFFLSLVSWCLRETARPIERVSM